MTNFIAGILVFSMCTIFFIQTSFAALLSDYTGTLGGQKIGLMIATNESFDSLVHVIQEGKITALHYFYAKHLKDIPLKLRKLDGRNIILEEYDSQNKLVGTFDLTFATEDPQKHFKTKEPLHREVLVGIWNGATGKESYPVYLIQIDSVDGSEDGGRCDLNGQEYQQLQEKISNFYTAVVNNDPTTLEKDFSFVMPHPPIRKTADWRKVVAETVPHDLFCNWKGYMLGDGIVWFDSDGNVITLH